MTDRPAQAEVRVVTVPEWPKDCHDMAASRRMHEPASREGASGEVSVIV